MEIIGLFLSLFCSFIFWVTVFSGEARAEGAEWLLISVAAHLIACALLHRQWLWMRKHPGAFLRSKISPPSERQASNAPTDTAWIYTLALLLPILGYTLSGPEEEKNSASATLPTRVGNLADAGGSPTIREAFIPSEDDPYTTNDESNDQPLGHFGTETLAVFSHDSGNYYNLDGDIEDGTLERLYFPKGGWVDFFSCDLDEDLQGECIDEEGRLWSIEGEG